ncbi:MAG: phosphoribulokinase [Euryarchaeota archaeon]|nr:phosphoribulokinase [Euryarchaeota archaeon]
MTKNTYTEMRNFRELLDESPYIFIIAVAGDSGSGKTTFTDALRSIFGRDLVSTITLDDYHLYDRAERDRLRITPLTYEANNFELLAKHLAALKRGETILKPVYNHQFGTLDEPIPFSPTKFIILEGLHPIVTPELREHIDYSIFIDPDTEVKYRWKIDRDIAKRNYTEEQVLAEIKEREPDYLKYVFPQRAHADNIITISFSKFHNSLYPPTELKYAAAMNLSRPQECVRDINLNIDLFSLLSTSDMDFMMKCSSKVIDGRKFRQIAFDGELTPFTIRKIELSIEAETGVYPINIFRGRDIITATDLMRLILAWRVINRRIVIGE